MSPTCHLSWNEPHFESRSMCLSFPQLELQPTPGHNKLQCQLFGALPGVRCADASAQPQRFLQQGMEGFVHATICLLSILGIRTSLKPLYGELEELEIVQMHDRRLHSYVR